MKNKYKSLKVNGIKVDEHRIIIENRIGRKLRKDEVVHHINGNKSDNRIENLKVMTRSEHSRFHSSRREIKQETRDKISNSSRGRINKQRAFNETIILDIYNMHKTGISNRDIAKFYNVCHETINCIINGKFYKEIYNKYKPFGGG